MIEQFDKKTLDLRPVLVKLLQGFLTHDQKKYWNLLTIHQEYVRNYFQVLGLYLHLNPEDGYAFLKTSPEENSRFAEENNLTEDEQDSGTAPFAGISLIKKLPLSFDVSLLLVLLRESLEQFDIKVNDDYRLILKRIDIYEMLKTFYYSNVSGGDETKLLKKFDSTITKVVAMDFLKELKNNADSFEVQRSIKAFLNASFLQEMKEKMLKHVGTPND